MRNLKKFNELFEIFTHIDEYQKYREYIENDGDVNEIDYKDNTMLITSIITPYDDIFDYILTLDNVDYSYTKPNGFNAFDYAIRRSYDKALKLYNKMEDYVSHYLNKDYLLILMKSNNIVKKTIFNNSLKIAKIYKPDLYKNIMKQQKMKKFNL
jgi:hypothetical protein